MRNVIRWAWVPWTCFALTLHSMSRTCNMAALCFSSYRTQEQGVAAGCSGDLASLILPTRKMNSNSSVSNGSASSANPDNKFVSDRLDPLLRKYATHLTATLSLVVGVTGVMMFYHLYKGKIQGMHEWFGMAFLAAFLLHIVRNRRQFLTLFKQNTMRVLLGVAAIVSLSFLLLAGPEKISPSKGLATALVRAPISGVAGALGVTVNQAVTRIVADESHASSCGA